MEKINQLTKENEGIIIKEQPKETTEIETEHIISGININNEIIRTDDKSKRNSVKINDQSKKTENNNENDPSNEPKQILDVRKLNQIKIDNATIKTDNIETLTQPLNNIIENIPKEQLNVVSNSSIWINIYHIINYKVTKPQQETVNQTESINKTKSPQKFSFLLFYSEIIISFPY